MPGATEPCRRRQPNLPCLPACAACLACLPCLVSANQGASLRKPLRRGYHRLSVKSMDPPRVLAIVPARGGSKGISRKNLQLLGGQPLVAHAVRAGRDARLVSRSEEHT